MKGEIEEFNIELNPELKPRGTLQFTSLSNIANQPHENAGKPKKTFLKKVYYSSSDFDKDKFISELGNHPIIRGYYMAYANHLPISISPDILWNLILRGFCIHVDKNSEKLRNKFIHFKGKKMLIVDGDEETIDSITKKGWEITFEKYVEMIRMYVGADMINNLTPNFSTTNHIIQVSSQIAIMATMKNYFTYARYYGGCGFPYINLQGTLDDYIQLRNKIEKLFGYDIDIWIKELLSIVDKIIETKKGNIDKNFWNNFVKNGDIEEEGLSGAMTIVHCLDGWLLNFYPYFQFENNETKNIDFVKRDEFNKKIDVKNVKTLNDDLVEVDLLMHHKIYNIDTQLIVKTGILGMIQEKNGLIKPEIGYYIEKKESEERVGILDEMLKKNPQLGGHYKIDENDELDLYS